MIGRSARFCAKSCAGPAREFDESRLWRVSGWHHLSALHPSIFPLIAAKAAIQSSHSSLRPNERYGMHTSCVADARGERGTLHFPPPVPSPPLAFPAPCASRPKLVARGGREEPGACVSWQSRARRWASPPPASAASGGEGTGGGRLDVWANMCASPSERARKRRASLEPAGRVGEDRVDLAGVGGQVAAL